MTRTAFEAQSAIEASEDEKEQKKMVSRWCKNTLKTINKIVPCEIKSKKAKTRNEDGVAKFDQD